MFNGVEVRDLCRTFRVLSLQCWKTMASGCLLYAPSSSSEKKSLYFVAIRNPIQFYASKFKATVWQRLTVGRFRCPHTYGRIINITALCCTLLCLILTVICMFPILKSLSVVHACKIISLVKIVLPIARPCLARSLMCRAATSFHLQNTRIRFLFPLLWVSVEPTCLEGSHE